jgi:DNA repair ATPase RecN
MILFDIRAELCGSASNEPEDSNPFQPGLAVSAVFEQVEPMRSQLARIASFHEPMQRLGELSNVFDELRKFEMQVSDLVGVLESMHNFQDRLRPFPNQFAPLEALDQKLKRLCESFGEHLSELADALGPAVRLQDQLAHLAGAFEPAKVLRQEFSRLAQTFASRSPAISDSRETAHSPGNPRR